MIQRTYGQVKDFLSTYALNNGVPVDDTRLIDYTNRAVRELISRVSSTGTPLFKA